MKGHLVIAGGNVKDNIIYEKFVELAGGMDAKIAIVPTASEYTMETLNNLSDIFEGCGVDRKNIISIKVDPDIKDNNEWKKCGDDFESLDFLKDVKGIWFSGGDQVRIIKGFQRDDGSDTKLLKRIKGIIESGGVIGGSSAGAAIMSEIMIGGGTSFGALSCPHFYNYVEYRNKPQIEDNGVLLIMRGLGFFNKGIIDQHFDKRSRQGRLLETLFDKKITMGFGISEDTALVYNIEKGMITVIGSEGIAIIDISDGARIKQGSYSKITNVKLSYLKGQDSYNINEDKYKINTENEMRESEYYAYMTYVLNILMNVTPDLAGSIGNMIKGYKKEMFYYSKEKKMYYVKSFQTGDRDVEYEVRLYMKEGYTRGFIERDYSFVNIIMDILPIKLEVEAEGLKKAAE